MIIEIQESIEEAKNEFREYERLTDPIKRIKRFINAIEILNDIVPKVADTEQRHIIIKIKMNRARQLFQSLSEIEFKDMFVWMHYLLATASLKEERETIFQENPELEKVFSQFAHIYQDELQEFLTQKE